MWVFWGGTYKVSRVVWFHELRDSLDIALDGIWGTGKFQKESGFLQPLCLPLVLITPSQGVCGDMGVLLFLTDALPCLSSAAGLKGQQISLPKSAILFQQCLSSSSAPQKSVSSGKHRIWELFPPYHFTNLFTICICRSSISSSAAS